MSLAKHIQNLALLVRKTGPRVRLQTQPFPYMHPNDVCNRPKPLAYLEKYLLTLTINYEYWTNHQDGSEGMAREAIACVLYEELLSKVAALRVAIVSDDHAQSLSIIEQIEQYLKGK